MREEDSNSVRTRSMYFSCQAGQDSATKIVRRFGLRGSKLADLPFANFFAAWDSADVMFDEVDLTYSRAADRAGSGCGTVGQSAF